MDTKYEFGRAADGSVVLIDEVNTPNSSRFWKAETYEERFGRGEEPENFDKEFVRIAYANKGYRGDGAIPVMPPGFVGGGQPALYHYLREIDRANIRTRPISGGTAARK